MTTISVTLEARPGEPSDRSLRVDLLDLPAGVALSGPSEIRPGQTLALTLAATPNARLGTTKARVTADAGTSSIAVDVAVTGNVDTRFGADGIVTFPFASRSVDGGEQVGIGVDGAARVYVTFGHAVGTKGDALPSVARCDPNGVVDTTFGESGFFDLKTFSPSDIPHAQNLVVDASGAFVVFGETAPPNEDKLTPFSFRSASASANVFPPLPPARAVDGVVARLARVGDTIFGVGLRAEAARYDGFLFRASAAGDPVPFGAEAYVRLPELTPVDVAATADGKLVVAGLTPQRDDDPQSDTRVSRRNADGTLDTTFGRAGIYAADEKRYNRPYGMTLDAEGRILVVGDVIIDTDANSSLRLARLTREGAPDLSFGTGGVVVVGPPPSAKALGFTARAVYSVGDKIYVAGAFETASETEVTAQSLAVARFTSAGALDTTFGSGGYSAVPVVTGPNDAPPFVVATQIAAHRGGIVVAATVDSATNTSNVVLVRYLP